LEAIYRSRYALSTDPKDKIYGLLGLLYDGGAFIPEPNYSQSVEETYIGLSKALIRKGFLLDLIYLRTSHRRISDSLLLWMVDWRNLNDTLAKQELEHIQALIERDSSRFSRNSMVRASFSKNTLTVRGTILGSIDGMGSAYSADRNETILDVVYPGKETSSVPLDFDRSTYVFNALLETQMLWVVTVKLLLSPVRLWSTNNNQA